MASIVLVHGAWQTAGTWDLVVPVLQRLGHTVHAPGLTGLDPGVGELTPAVSLDTHIDDVVRLLETEDLRNVVLVGHSYAGMIITGVAERAAERIHCLVYVDAFVPDDGQRAFDFLPESLRATMQAQAAADGGFRLRGSERQLDLWGLKPGPAREFVQRHLGDFSVRCFEQPLRLPARRAQQLGRAYVACVGDAYPARPVFAPFLQQARAQGWHCHELPTGHDCHAEMPDEFCRILNTFSGANGRCPTGATQA